MSSLSQFQHQTLHLKQYCTYLNRNFLHFLSILYNFTIMNSLPFCLVFVFASLSSATKELQLPPIPLSLFHPPADFEPSQFLNGQKFNGNNFDSNQLPQILQKILGGVAQVLGKFPFIQGIY